MNSISRTPLAQLDVALIALAAPLLANLLVHVAQAGVGVIIEILAKHERLHQLLESSQWSLLKGLALSHVDMKLPGPPLRTEILFQCRERAAERAIVARRKRMSTRNAKPSAVTLASEVITPTPQAIEEILIGERAG